MNYLYIPHGPEIHLDQITGGLKNELAQFVSYIKNLAREQKSIFIKIEPLQDSVIELLYGASADWRIKKSSKEIQPHRSVIMDLEKSEEELLGAMHHKTRYNIRVGEKKGLQLREKDDLESFWKLLKHTAKNDNFSTHEKSYYEKLLNTSNLHARTVFVEHDARPLDDIKDRLIAGAILLTHGDTLYYLHGAMDRDYKPMMAPYILHWQIIKRAKEQGLKHYDFWGIDAKKWSGVTRFKLGWGGCQVEYPGAFDIPIRSFWFLVYKIVRKIF
jgi:lipid II:glycine glycyltransferase (peptidoglycan interpeptide bridge formation enzyme)